MTALQLDPSAQAPCTRTMLGSAVMSGLLPGLRSVLLGSTCAYVVESRMLTGQPANSRTRRAHRPRNAGPSLAASPRSGLLSSRLPTPPGMPGPVGPLKAPGSWRYHGASLRFDPGHSGQREAVQPLLVHLASSGR